jgi:flagellar biosynthesis protein FlhG
MNDQASTLRLIASNKNPNKMMNTIEQINVTEQPKSIHLMHTLAISGGKGGVGKSNLSVNLALALGSLGKEVTLLDADFGLANADLLCGVTPEFHLGHVVAGIKEIEEIMIMLSSNVRLIPSGSGIEELANMSLHHSILRKLQKMENSVDFMLIDTAAGIADNVMGILMSAAQVIVVATPEPTSIVDAYATIKTILQNSPKKSISIVVNNVVGVGDAEQVFNHMNSATQRFLDHKLNFLGMIPHDLEVVEAVREQTPFIEFAPNTPASRAVRLIAKQINSQIRETPFSAEIAQSFWDKLASN